MWALLGLPAPGGRGVDLASAAPGDTRPVLYARELRRDPVVVSPALRRVVSVADEAALRRDVAAMPFPTFVVLAPKLEDEPDVETFTELPGLIHDRLGRDGLYLVADESGIYVEAETYGIRTRGDVGRIGSVVLDAVPRDDGPVARVRFALRNLATGARPTRSVEAERRADDALPYWLLGVSALVAFVVPVGIADLRPAARRRRAARRRERAAAIARAAEERATLTVDRGEARRAALEAVSGLAREIAEAQTPPDAALRSYDAASHVVGDDDATAVDFVGAWTLAETGRAQLRGRTWRPCLFDPRHGEGVRRTRWRQGDQDVTIPACAACAKAVSRGRSPDVLQDRGRPYWDRDTTWARTGFGAIDDDVADVVLAGGRSAR